MDREEIVGKVIRAIFEERAGRRHQKTPALRVPYAQSVTEYPKYHVVLRKNVELFLTAVDALGLSVVDLNMYTPKKILRLSQVAPTKRPARRMDVEVSEQPMALRDISRHTRKRGSS